MIYRLRYCNKDGVEARVDIQKGLATPVIEVEGTERPFILSYNNDKGDKSGMFLSSSADIEIYETTDFNIDNLKTSNETELSVTHYINNVVSWRGFIIPDFFSIEVRSNPVIAMTASDRIGTLKSVTLSNLPSMITNRELCVQCLEKTGLNLPLKTLADFHNGVDDFFNSKVLSQRLTDLKGRSISCYDILCSILTQTNSKLLQRDGAWHIINKYQHELGSGKLYSSETSSTDWADSIHNFNELTKGARRLIVPVASSVGVYHEHGGGKTYPENSDFSQGLSGWTTYNDFDCEINNNEVLRYIQDFTYWRPSLGVVTEKNNLRCNRNPFNPKASNNPYVESPPIVVTYPDSNSVEVTIDINAISTGAFIAATSYINFAVIAKAPDNSLYSLGGSGSFTSFSGNPYFHRERVMAEASGAATTVFKGVKGVLTIDDDNLEGYNFYVRIYGSGGAFTPFINSVSASFMQPSDNPKGLIYKTEQGVNFTKTHEIETSIFGDFMTGGLNGYFYPYPIDDTSSLYNSNNELTSKWSAPNDNEELPLLQHTVRQKARMFSVAHDVLRGELEISNFDPLFIFKDCNNTRYSLISGKFDFLNSSAEVEIEEIKYLNINRRDFIYSYFGDGESGIKSIGGISGGSGGGGTGGGLTPEQLEILSWWKKDPDNPNTIFTEMNAYSKLELSAYGAGTGGGGGGGIIETVYGYDNLWQTFNNSILTDTFNAYTINQINTRLVSVENGSATTVNTTGTGNAITSISKAGSVITANKDLTFSLSGHTHTISDITNLQTTLNNKLETSIFNTHNTDNVRHITGAERTKWDGVVTDFDNLEIGGRNLVLNSNNNALFNMFRAGVQYTKTSGVTVPEWKTSEANRIQTTGGSELLKFYATLININGEILAGDTVSASIYIKNNSANSIKVDSNLGGREQTISAGQAVKIRWDNITFNNVNPLQVRVFGAFTTDSLDFIWWRAKAEKGTIPTDWTPAPEDQVSDWNTTDVNSFSFIKNKPTLLSQFTDNIGVATHIANTSNPHSVTKSQVGLGNVDNTPDSAKNVLSATKLQTARTIAGVSFDGTANIAIPFANLSSKPTTLSEYGIVDAMYENNTRDNHDLNTLKTQGFYALSGNPLNAPAGSGYSNILVVQSSSDRFAQMNFQMSYNEIYYRNGKGGTTTWGSWRQIAFRDSNVASATKLQTARNIAGVAFNGTADIAIPFANLSSKPTTLSGYGITDAAPISHSNTSGELTIHHTHSNKTNLNTINQAMATTNTVTFAANILTTFSKAPKFDLGNGWTIEASGAEMHFKLNGVVKGKFIDGAFVSMGELTAYVAAT